MKHAVALLSVLCCTPPTLAADKYQPQVGESHRAFVLPDIGSGKPVSLSDYRGSKVLLIHFASW